MCLPPSASPCSLTVEVDKSRQYTAHCLPQITTSPQEIQRSYNDDLRELDYDRPNQREARRAVVEGNEERRTMDLERRL